MHRLTLIAGLCLLAVATVSGWGVASHPRAFSSRSPALAAKKTKATSSSGGFGKVDSAAVAQRTQAEKPVKQQVGEAQNYLKSHEQEGEVQDCWVAKRGVPKWYFAGRVSAGPGVSVKRALQEQKGLIFLLARTLDPALETTGAELVSAVAPDGSNTEVVAGKVKLEFVGRVDATEPVAIGQSGYDPHLYQCVGNRNDPVITVEQEVEP